MFRFTSFLAGDLQNRNVCASTDTVLLDRSPHDSKRSRCSSDNDNLSSQLARQDCSPAESDRSHCSSQSGRKANVFTDRSAKKSEGSACSSEVFHKPIQPVLQDCSPAESDEVNVHHKVVARQMHPLIDPLGSLRRNSAVLISVSLNCMLRVFIVLLKMVHSVIVVVCFNVHQHRNRLAFLLEVLLVWFRGHSSAVISDSYFHGIFGKLNLPLY
jgi:hypothetical protein